jgi:hypothetical protein
VSEPTIICVLGMHRSGTSLVARLLNLLGVDLGPEEHLMKPGPANPAGHWESEPISEINEDIFLRLGGSWAKPPPLPAGWERSPELAEHRQQARELIASDFSGSDLWGFKDPRTCLTAPFWQRLLPPMRYLICLRNPMDVAASLWAREEEPVPLDEGLELWLTYVRASLAAAAGHPHELIFYEDLMTDPEPVVATLAEFVGRQRGDAAKRQARKAIRVALSDGLWHHQTPVPSVVDAPDLGFHIKSVYLALRLFVPRARAAGIDVLDLFGAYAAEAGRYVAGLEHTRAELDRVREQTRITDRQRVALEHQLRERTAELERVMRSYADEQRARRRLETELELTRKALEREGQEPAPSAPPKDEQAEARERLIADVRERARELIPSGSTVLVAGKGDDELLRLNGSRGLHFPVGADGRYAGHHPAGDTAVIAQLEALRARGADHLLLPATTLWWLDHYQGLRRHLEDRYQPLLEDERCAIYRLSPAERSDATEPISALKRIAASFRIASLREPSILDWHTGLDLGEHLPEMPVIVPPDKGAALPYLDGTIDVVVVASTDPAQIAEARRVAASGVIRVDPTSSRCELEWSAADAGGWGRDVSVTLLPNGESRDWEATVAAFVETLGDGFAGALSVAGHGRQLEPANAWATGGVRVRAVEVPSGATLAQRARTAVEDSDERFHVFIAEPAVPLPDWLPSILGLFSGDRDAAVVGSRIIAGDGTLAEAGGVLNADGSRVRRGEGDHDPDRPEYCFVQRVDFCSPPLLATRRDLFEQLAGFDDRPRVSAEALVDFSLRAGRTGAPVYYQPQARIVALGSGSR